MSTRHSVIFECEIITPMFLAGADGKTPELRAPSIKGMMRYWWRAIRAENNIEDLHTQEARMFGSSDEKIGKSKFSVRMTSKELVTNDFSPVPHSTKKFKFKGLDINQQFSIVLSGKNDIVIYKEILEVALLLGGLGKRSRRGFGSIHCKNWDFADSNILLDFSLEKLNAVKSDFEIKEKKILRKTKCATTYPFIQQICVGTKKKDINTLLQKIGQATSNYKNPSLGYAGKYNNDTIRMASPIYVSIARVNNGFVPVITTLNSAFPSSYPKYDFSKQNNFKDSL